VSRARAAIALAAAAVAAALPAPAGAAVPAHGRAWELVTPGDPVAPMVLRATEVSADGRRIAYLTAGVFPDAPAGDLFATNMATRGATGWQTTPLGLAYTNPSFAFSPLLVALSADLGTSVWRSDIPIPPDGHADGGVGMYVRHGDGQVERIVEFGSEEGGWVGASEALDTLVVHAAAHLLPSDAGRTEGHSIYEFTGSTLRQVDVDSGGALLSACGSLASAEGVSRSGERIFFTNPAPDASCVEPSRVYLRIGGASTIEVSASQCDRPDCSAEQPVTFVGATPSGSSAFLVTAQQLTDEDVDSGADLYRFDVGSGILTMVSASPPGATGEVGPGRVFPSADGSRVYLHAQGQLLPGEGSELGQNLYLADGAGLKFVAAVGADDPLQVSADGGVALIETAVGLAAGDVDGQLDVYRYDAESEALEWLSQGPSGGTAPFPAKIESTIPVIGLDDELKVSRALVDDGSRSFFSTEEALLEEDENSALDVYEWHAGTLGLVSSGVGESGAEFATASHDGSTVVFKTDASLIAADRDGGELDLYAARLGGGFPALPEAGDCGLCDPPLAAPLARPAPASASDGEGAKQKRLRLRRIAAGAGRRFAATGRLTLALSVPAPGLVTARISGEIGGRTRTIARGDAGAVRPGVVRIALRSTPLARSRLAAGATLKARIAIRQSNLRLVRRLTLRGAVR
jgi:hypothetical protein